MVTVVRNGNSGTVVIDEPEFVPISRMTGISLGTDSLWSLPVLAVREFLDQISTGLHVTFPVKGGANS